MRFGAILRRVRKQRGWTLVQLSAYSGMNPSYLGVIEAGGNMLSVETLLTLAQLYGVEAAEIVREVEQARREEQRLQSAAPALRDEAAPQP